MSKRKKRNSKRHNKATPNKLSAPQLKLQAEQALTNGHYKLAIAHLKVLLKKTDQSESITTLLQQAYKGRAKELADKKMLKEAISIWEVATQYGVDPIAKCYLEWIINAQQYFRLGKIYDQLSVETKRDLQPQLASCCLSGNLSVLKILPKDDLVQTGYQSANALLQAWCSGADEVQLNKLIKAISFRSPYRDLRQIIQAWLLLEKSPQQTNKIIARIAKTSPFYPLVEQLHLAQLNIPEVVAQLPSLSTQSRNCAIEIRGWSDTKTVKILKKLQQLGGDPVLKTLSNILLGLCKQLKQEQLTPETKYWLYNASKKVWAISRTDNFNPSFKQLKISTGDLTTLEQRYYTFLSATTNHAPPQYLQRKVDSYLDELKVTPNKEVKKVDKLLISAIMNRYLLDKRKRSNENKITKNSLPLLEQLLLDDPADSESWQELLQYHLQQKQLKPARDAVNKALKHHPNNIKILDLAIRIAIMGNAFKKAAGYAKRILAVDPINSSAQQHVQYAHLSHARKVLKQKKWHLVDKEIEAAQQWKSSTLSNTLIEVLKAFQVQAKQGVIKAANTFQSLTKTTQMDKVALDFIIRHQAEQTNQSYKTSLRNAKLVGLWNKPNKQKVLALLDIAQQLRKIDAKSIAKPLKSLFKSLKKGAKSSFSAKEGEQICEFWLQTEEEELLREYSNQLRQTYKDKPVFVYYFFVKYRSFGFYDELEDALELAKQQGDEAVSARIIGILQEFSGPFGGVFFDEEDDDDWGMPSIEDAENMMDIMDAATDIDKRDMNSKANMIANMIPMMPTKAVLEIAGDLIGEELSELILSGHNEEKLREICQRCLRGENPEEIIMEVLTKSNRNPPFIGDLF